MENIETKELDRYSKKLIGRSVMSTFCVNCKTFTIMLISTNYGTKCSKCNEDFYISEISIENILTLEDAKKQKMINF